MLHAIINFEVILNITLLLLVVCLSGFITIQGQKLRDYEKRTAKMQLQLQWQEKSHAVEKRRLAA